MRHLELFAGIGGFRRALDLVGRDLHIPMECVGFSEIDKNAKKTYRANFNLTPQEVDMDDIVSFTSVTENIHNLPDFDLLTAGFPCQSFSMMGHQEGCADKERGQMFFRIIDILQIKRPRYVILENVKNLHTHDKGNTFRVIREELEKLGYSVYFDIFNSNNFGVAQIRNRVFIVCIHGQHNIAFSNQLVKEYFDEICNESSLDLQNSVLDVLAEEVENKYFLSERIKPTILSDGSANFRSKSDINKDPARPLTASMHKMHRACQDNYYSENFILSLGEDNPVEYSSKEELCRLRIRKLTPQEAMRLQGFPNSWSTNAQAQGVPDGALYKQAGNAISVNTVYAILRYCLYNNIFIE